MRVLVYNWIPFDEQMRGGGVTVYTRNLINELLITYPDMDITFLCAGAYYDDSDRRIRCEKVQLNYNTKCEAYTIVNSPVFAPAYLSIFHIKNTLIDTELKPVFMNFIREHGPFDVIHLQNLEGLSLSCLEFKKEKIQSRIIYSLHNYYPFCPRVDLWQKKNELCTYDNTGEECIDCMICHVPSEKLIKKMSLTYELRKEYTPQKKELFDQKAKQIDADYYEEETRELTTEEKTELSHWLHDYRNSMVRVINEHFDCVLAVSKRVAEIAYSKGIKRELISLSYIGTEVAEKALNMYRGDGNPPFTVVYMGYQNNEKGFFFLMNALDEISEDVAAKIDLIIAARGNAYGEDIQRRHRAKFHSVSFRDGYTREEIPEILSISDLGIIPVLWEDNLPQVAIEMIAYGVPIICSDRGGAKELVGNNRYVFEAGNINSFTETVEAIVNNPSYLSDFFDGYPGLTKMSSHVVEIMKLYQGEELG